jgi:phosphoribosyl 1,2-cyclic phosphodiesterase
VAKVKAIFISHEHTDHTRGAEVLSRKFGIPVYITGETYRHSRMKLEPRLIRNFSAGTPVQIGNLVIDAFPKSHDASEPHSFTVSSENVTTGIFTDIGTVCSHLIYHFKRCHAAFLESNYDEKMLLNGRYPAFLKKRIQGMEGHLSNVQALDLFTSHRNAALQLLVLSHLSAENNHPELVEKIFKKHANGTKIVVASRYGESELFILTGKDNSPKITSSHDRQK